jgi:hypothetical protein
MDRVFTGPSSRTVTRTSQRPGRAWTSRSPCLGQAGRQGAVELHHGGAIGQQRGQPDFPGPAGDLPA